MSHSFLNSVFLLYFKQNLKATKDIINVFDLIAFFKASSQILPPLRNFTKLHIKYLWYSPQVCIFSFLYLVAQCPDTGAPRGNCCAVNLSTVCRTPRGTWPRGWGWLGPSGPVCPHHWPPSATDCREKRMSLRKGHFNNFIENEKKQKQNCLCLKTINFHIFQMFFLEEQCSILWLIGSCFTPDQQIKIYVEDNSNNRKDKTGYVKY